MKTCNGLAGNMRARARARVDGAAAQALLQAEPPWRIRSSLALPDTESSQRKTLNTSRTYARAMMRDETRSHVRADHGGRRAVHGDVIDFSSNTGPLGPPRSVTSALEQSSHLALEYPDPDADGVREAIAAKYGIGAECIVVGNGATEIIYEYARAFVSKGTRVLVQAPTFAEYRSATELCGGLVESHHTMDIAAHMPEFLSDIPRNACVFVCNPNNPTGTLIERRHILEIAEHAAKMGSQLFVDECFIEFAQNDESVIHDVTSLDNVFVLRSFTKIFGIPGVRIGYGAGTRETVHALAESKVPWSVSGAAQAAAIAALGDNAHIADVQRALAIESAYLHDAIDAIDGFSCATRGTANFVLVKSSRMRAAEICTNLLEKRILVRDCSSFEGLDDSFIRVATRSHEDNEILVRELGSL